MARFQSGIWDGHHIKAKPVGWRGWIPGYDKWAPPYQAGSKVVFEIELIDAGVVRLFNLPFYVVNTACKKEERIPIDSAKQEIKTTIDQYSTPSDGILQVWAGNPEGRGSLQLVHADTWNPTNLVVAIVTAVVTIIVSEVVQALFGQ
jgi:hypothetical protein